MEMQQSELFNPRFSKITVGSHLRLVQPGETAADFSGRAVRPQTRGHSKKQTLSSAIRGESEASPRSQKARGAGLRGVAPEHVERFLNSLRGEALLVGALSYDLGLRLSQLRFLRIRDVNLSARVIELSDGVKQIPAALYEDLSEHISERVCGYVADQGVQKRDQLLFSHVAFEEVLSTCASFLGDAQREAANVDGAAPLKLRVRDNFLRVMGWFHVKRAAKRVGRISSPLGLFDKGPKIVRRDRGGVVHSYYLWRAVYSR